MDWIDRLNAAVRHIEANITGEIDSEQLARIACCSPYHFQRMFASIAGVPLSVYIRRRRMSLAAVDLRGGASILDVSLRYGYSSPTAFNRAFQSVHGVPPSKARGEGVRLSSYPPLVFILTIKGVEEMQYQIKKQGAIRVVGLSTPLYADYEKNRRELPAFWDRMRQNGALDRLLPLMDGPVPGLLAVCADGDPGRYFIAVASHRAAGAFEEFTVPAATWAVFTGAGGADAIQALESRIASEWLPTSGYAHTGGPELELYLDDGPDDFHFEVWIPVAPKQA